jgi:hypothetical protein
MRLLQLLFVIALIAVGMAVSRDPIGRVFLVVFLTGVGEFAFGLTAVMALFQTVGAFGEARSVQAHLEAVAATGFVLAIATAVMSGWLFAGVCLVLAVA